MVYSTRRFVLCLTVCHFVLVFFSPFSIAITSLGEERSNLSAFHTFVRFVLVWICRFPLPLGVWERAAFCDCGTPWTFLLPFLQAVTLSKSIRICSVYLPHTVIFSKQDLENLINQLPRPYILIGDFNSHSKPWGCLDTNDKGEIIEKFIAKNDLCLFNDKQPTYLHSPTRNNFALDLSIRSPDIYLNFDWSVVDDLHGSDHFPVKIEQIESTNKDHHSRWNLSKANWGNLHELCN